MAADLTELAAETGISASTLSRLEAGLRRPTLDEAFLHLTSTHPEMEATR